MLISIIAVGICTTQILKARLKSGAPERSAVKTVAYRKAMNRRA